VLDDALEDALLVEDPPPQAATVRAIMTAQSASETRRKGNTARNGTRPDPEKW
jgi:hypothetical protein